MNDKFNLDEYTKPQIFGILGVIVLAVAFTVASYPIWSYEFNEVAGGNVLPETGQGESVFGNHSYTSSPSDAPLYTEKDYYGSSTARTIKILADNFALLTVSIFSLVAYIIYRRRRSENV